VREKRTYLIDPPSYSTIHSAYPLSQAGVPTRPGEARKPSSYPLDFPFLSLGLALSDGSAAWESGALYAVDSFSLNDARDAPPPFLVPTSPWIEGDTTVELATAAHPRPLDLFPYSLSSLPTSTFCFSTTL
jgi:hypothetical protein